MGICKINHALLVDATGFSHQKAVAPAKIAMLFTSRPLLSVGSLLAFYAGYLQATCTGTVHLPLNETFGLLLAL